MWVPPVAPLADEWVPGADLRHVRALPVLVIAGSDLEAAVAAVVEDLADFEIVVEQEAPSELEPFESRTVAVLNRGMPGFAVDSDGTLHTSLMRSCTGWPSGTWIDPPRRTAPDGSNFQLQHWTHTFEYALVSGDGDWRQAGIPARSAEFSRPPLAVAENTRAAGGLPTWGSLLEIEPAGSVQLGALKAAGNPIARGSAQPVHPSDGVAIRLVETSGTTTDVVVRSGLRRVSAAARVDLLEQPRCSPHAPDGLTLHGYEIATVLTRLNLPQVLEADHAVLAPDAEAAQPLYARYWLHNRGPAALGGLPAVAYLHPAAHRRRTGFASAAAAYRRQRLQRHRAARQGAAAVSRRLDGRPRRAAVHAAARRAPGDRRVVDRACGQCARAVPGARGTRTDGQPRVDAAGVAAGGRGRVRRVGRRTRRRRAAAAGQRARARRRRTRARRARLAVTVGTDAHADLAVEAHLISPWGTWEWMGPAAIGAELAARGTAELGFDVAPPPWVEPGEWWALIRVGGAGSCCTRPR